jgi:hypothetical protein
VILARRIIVSLVVVALCASSSFALGEILHGVYPLETFGEIRAKYPNGAFKRVYAAWVKPSQAFYSMEGSGFPGKLMLLFDDERPGSKERYTTAKCEADVVRDDTQAFLCVWYKASMERKDDDALSISWVRWVPETPIPIERYKAKYGEPTKIDYSSIDMKPYAYWGAAEINGKRGLKALLTATG